jgi:hypothetical protein
MAVFWGVTPCSLIDVDRRFRGAYCLHYQVALILEAASYLHIHRRENMNHLEMQCSGCSEGNPAHLTSCLVSALKMRVLFLCVLCVATHLAVSLPVEPSAVQEQQPQEQQVGLLREWFPVRLSGAVPAMNNVGTSSVT